jgi:hypothetical protein
MVTLCRCVTMCPERLHGHPEAKGDHATQPHVITENAKTHGAYFTIASGLSCSGWVRTMMLWM